MIDLFGFSLLLLALTPIALIGLARLSFLLKPCLAWILLLSCLGMMTLTLLAIPIFFHLEASGIIQVTRQLSVDWGLWALASVTTSILWVVMIAILRHRSGA
ncbi:membrane protein (plasmid) [Marinobacter adhaerens HP15]|uniref:Membrane protein n=1 Tax=Marinobacter adhaerens (strain DSM 23420 / HP15) TaxID=225937 RepID=E4PRY7_MARAH|nr:membrane protein [Marinobacter adhaerens HP15]